MNIFAAGAKSAKAISLPFLIPTRVARFAGFLIPKRRISSDVSPAWPCASLRRTPELSKKSHPLGAGRTTIVPSKGELPCPNAG
jgi:hypothetical protein